MVLLLFCYQIYWIHWKGLGLLPTIQRRMSRQDSRGMAAKKENRFSSFFFLLLHCFFFERKNFHQEVLNHDGVGCSTAKEVINNSNTVLMGFLSLIIAQGSLRKFQRQQWKGLLCHFKLRCLCFTKKLFFCFHLLFPVIYNIIAKLVYNYQEYLPTHIWTGEALWHRKKKLLCIGTVIQKDQC